MNWIFYIKLALAIIRLLKADEGKKEAAFIGIIELVRPLIDDDLYSDLIGLVPDILSLFGEFDANVRKELSR